MTDAFGLPIEGEEPECILESLIAAGQWSSGGNSTLARRLRVAMQRRDRYGRWAEMGGGVSFKGRLGGGVATFIGRYVGPAERDNYLRVYIGEDQNGAKKGIYEVPSKVATVAKAIIGEEDLAEAGVKLDVNSKRVGEVLDRDIEPIEDMFKGAPNEADQDIIDNAELNADEQAVQDANRKKAPSYKSYNVVDKKGNPVSKEDQGKPEASDEFPGPYVAGNPTDEQLLWARRNIHSQLGVPEAGFYPDKKFEDLQEMWDEINREPNLTEAQRNARRAPIRSQLLIDGQFDRDPRSRDKALTALLDNRFEPQPLRPPVEEALPPVEPKVDAAAQKLVKDVSNGDVLIDTTGFEEPALQHIGGVITSKSYDTVRGTATFEVTTRSGEKVSLVRRIDGVVGISPRESREGGNRLSRSGNAAYQEWLNNQRRANVPPQTESPQPQGPEDGGGPRPPSDGGDGGGGGDGSEPPSDGGGDDTSPTPSDDEEFDVVIEAGDDGVARVVEPTAGESDSTFPDLISEHDKLDGVNLPPKARKALDNLLEYRKKALAKMKRAAVARDEETYERNYAIASTTTRAINQLVDAHLNGDVMTAPFFRGDEASRIDNMRILKSSVVTGTVAQGDASDLPVGSTFIQKADAIAIAKDGMPFFLKFRNGSGVYAYTLDANGLPEHMISSLGVSELGGTATGRNNDLFDAPNYASIGMIKTHVKGSRRYDLNNGAVETQQNNGLAGFTILMARWASQRSGRRFSHSGTLYAPGNFYSKMVSLNMLDHSRTQREKFIFERYGRMDHPLFKVMDSQGLLSDSFKKPLTITTQEGGANESPMWNSFASQFSDTSGKFPRKVRQFFKDNPDAIPGVDYPDIFEDHVKSPQGDVSKFDVQTILLQTTFKDGDTRDEAVAKLRALEDSLARWEAQLTESQRADALGGALRLISTERQKLKSFVDAFEKVDFPDDFRVEQNKGLEDDKVKFFDSPFAGTSGFTQFDAPSDVRAVPVGPDFDFRTIIPDGQPEDWTELPSLLAGRFSTEELVRGLRDAVLTNKDGRIVSISRDGKNYEVQGGSVYRALMDQGADAADILAKIYDEARGDNVNSDKLSKFREQLRPIQEDIDKLRAQFGELAPAVDFNVIGGNYEEVNGIAFADPVVRRAGDDVPTAQKLRPIVENTNFILGAAGRGSNIYDSQRPYAPQLTAEDWVFDGITDDPRIIARNFSPRTLKNALMDSIRGRKRLVKLQFANGSQRDVAIDAIRDALQHQGVDVQGYITADRSLNFTVPKNTVSQLGLETLRDGTTVAKYSIGQGNTQLSIRVKTDAPGQQVIVDMMDSDGVTEHSVGAITFENGQYFVSYRSPSKRDGSRPFGAVDGDADQVPFATLGEAALNLRVALIDDLNANNNSTGFFPTLNALVKLATRDEVDNFGKGEIALLEPRIDFVQPEPGERNNIRFASRATYGRAGRLGSQKILLTEYNKPEETDLVTRTTLFDGTVVVDQFGKVSTRDDGLFSYQNNATGEVKLYETRDAAVLAMGRDYAVANGHKNIVISDEKVLEDYDRELAQKGVSAGDFVVNDSADERVGVAPAKLADGAIGEVSITLNKRNPGRFRQDNPHHVLASFEIKPSSPDGAINNAPVISGSVKRTGLGTWTVEINQPGQPRIRQTFRPNDQQANAVTYMAEKLILNYGLDAATVSDILRVNRPLQARPARAPDVTPPSNALPADQILQPENMPVNAERVQNVLDRVQNQMVTFPVSLIAVNRNEPGSFRELEAAGYVRGPRLGGAGGAFSLVLPDGRTVKIKTNSRIDTRNRGRKNRMEALVHHLFDMGGIITTGGGLGQDSDGNVVMAEVLEPRTVNGNPWQTMPQLDPAYEKAREDLRRARVFEAWFNEEDSMNNSGNHLLIRDKNGDFRVVICDGGGMLKYGALHMGENGGFTRDHVRDYLERRGKFRGLIEAFEAGRLDEQISFTGGTMTPRQFQQILRERVLPFTPDLIRRAVSGSLTDPDDIRDTADNLIRRRAEMLELFGIPDVHANNQNSANPNVSAPAGGDGGGGGTPPSGGGGGGGDGGGGPSSSTTPPNFPPDSSIVEFEKEDGGPAGRLAVRSTGPDAREVFDEDGRVVGKTFKRSNGDHVVVMNPDDADRPEGVRLVAHVFDGSNPLARTGAMNMLSALATRASGGNIDGTQINLFDPTGDRLDANLFDIGERAKENGRKYENVGAFVDQQARTVSESTRNTVVDLIRSKEMPSAERRSLNDLLSTPELLGGEAVYVERQIRAYPDRARSDIARSDAANANNAGDARQPSDLDNAQPARDNVLVTVDKLVAGDVVDGLGRVAFVSDAGEGRVAVGYIPNAGGPLRVIQIPSTSAVRRVTNPEGQGTDLPGGNNNVARFRQEGNETINDVKRAYPNHRVLPNGDLVVATRTYTEARGNKFLYEVVVHRNGTEEFVAYARRVRLDANNNPIPGTEEAAGRTHYAHSSQALLNRVPALINNGNRGIMAPAPGRWFTQLGDRKPEVIDPRTGQLIHPDVLPNRHGNFIGDTGIEKTGNGVKDSLISYIAELVDRGVDTRDIIARMTRQRVLDNNQLMDVIERIEAARRFPGINAVPYVGKDRNTIVRVGDVVDHFDFEGNLLKRGGVVKSRRRLVVYDKVQGRYEYRDILYVQFPGRRGQTPIAARRLQPTQRGDGSPVRTIADEAGGVAPIVPSRVEVVEPINMRDGGGENLPLPNGYQVVVRSNGTTVIREDGDASPTKAYALIQPPVRDGEKFKASAYNADEMAAQDAEEFDSYQEAQDWAINSINDINAGAAGGGSDNNVVPSNVVEKGTSDADSRNEGRLPQAEPGRLPRGLGLLRRENTLVDSNGNVVARLIDHAERDTALREQGIPTPDLFEVAPGNEALFHRAITDASRSNAYGSSLSVPDNASDYVGTRLFMTEDGLAGFGVKADGDIISVFRHENGPQGVGRSLVANAVAQGGYRLDAYDTVLPKIYAKEGFVPIARVKFDGAFVPNWDRNLYREFNNGEPDVVFMAYNPNAVGNDYSPLSEPHAENYDKAAEKSSAILDDYIRRIEGQIGVPYSVIGRMDMFGDRTKPRIAEALQEAIDKWNLDNQGGRQPGDQTDVGIAGYVEEFGDGFANWIAPLGFKQMDMVERRRLGKPYGFYRLGPNANGKFTADFFDANGTQRAQNFDSVEEARQYLLDNINDAVGDGFQVGEGIPSGFREVTLIADMWMVRGTIDGEDAYSTYSTTPNGTGGGYDYGFYKSGVRLGGGTKPSIAEARQAGIDLITELIDAPVAEQQGNGGVGAPDNFINRLPAGYKANFFGDSVIAFGQDPRQPAALWDASNGDVLYFSTYQRYLERGFDGADESEMGVFNRADFDNKAVEHINLAQQENLPVIQLNDAFKRVLTDREITAQLPAGYQNESRALEGFDGPATIFFNPNDPNAKAVAIDRDNGEVRIYGSYQQILDNDGARSIYDGLYDPMRAQVKVIQLIDRDALYRAPAAEQQGGGQSNAAGALPEGYERNDSAGGRHVEIKGTESGPYGYANRTANGWEANHWDSYNDFLAGNSPRITPHADLDSALQDVIEQINLANQRNNPPVAPIPDGYELNDIDGTLPMFEVQRTDDTANGGYVLAEQGADGRWQAQSWASKSDAERRRFQRPDSSESFDTREEAVAWAGSNVGAPNANGNSTGLSDAEVQAEMALMNLGDADMIRNVFPNGNYNNRVRRMAALHKKFREMPYEVESGLQTGQGSGVNEIQRIRFEDGTYAYLKASPAQARMHEVAAGFLLEAVGINPNEDWIAARVKNEFGEDRVLMDHRENEVQGRSYGGNAAELKNAREIGLFDVLFENGDRHPGNWLVNGDTAIPIDHGFIMFGAPAYGIFKRLVEKFQDGDSDYADLFTKNELITIKTRLRALGLLFNGMQMEQERRGDSSDYEQKLEDAIERLDELIGVAR